MKRTVVLMSVILFLMCLWVSQTFYLGAAVILVLMCFCQKKHRLLMLVFVGLSFLWIYGHCQHKLAYTGVDYKIHRADLYAYKTDYILAGEGGYKVLVKNDLKKMIRPGTYRVTYEKNEFYYENPGTFNYQNYLYSMDFVDVVNLSEVGLEPVAYDGAVKALKYRLYWALDRRIEACFEVEQTRAVVKSLLLANKTDLPESVVDVFMANGTSHVLAISGMHIGIFFMMFKYLFAWTKARKHIYAFGGVLVFLWLIGWPYSGLRAGFLMAGMMVCKPLRRPYDLLQTLALVAIVLMVNNPYVIYHAGFQYSFCALIVIGCLYPYFFAEIKHKFMGLLSLSLCLQVALMPLTLYYQPQINILSFVANILTVPLMTLLVYTSFIASVLPLQVLVSAVDVLVEVLININGLIDGLHAFKVTAYPWPLWMILAFYLSMSMVYERAYRKKIGGLVLVIGLMAGLYGYFAVEVYFLDVGQGDAILIKHRFQNTLIDSGPETEGDILKEILRKNRVKTLDNVFISHSHMDHIGGLKSIDNLTREALWFYKSGNESNAGFQALYKHKMYNTDAYDDIALKGLQVAMIKYPSQESLNDSSMVMVVDAYHMSFLFTGDIEEEVEGLLLDHLPKIDVLKVPHHGSKTSSTQAFIDCLKPSVAVVCVGKNFYGHPDPGVVQAYRSRGIDLRLTQTGAVKMIVLPFKIHWLTQM